MDPIKFSDCLPFDESHLPFDESHHMNALASGLAKACPAFDEFLEQTGGLFKEGERPDPNHDQMAAMCGEQNSYFHGEQNECVGFMQKNGMDPIKESDCWSVHCPAFKTLPEDVVNETREANSMEVAHVCAEWASDNFEN